MPTLCWLWCGGIWTQRVLPQKIYDRSRGISSLELIGVSMRLAKRFHWEHSPLADYAVWRCDSTPSLWVWARIVPFVLLLVVTNLEELDCKCDVGII